ncbi:hypothetical protein Y032_0044g997 [Ancylostoma ceylanicum]|uniref:GIY-YIG domain-containing protein n=1 Tax=Ancylostoma ceylanicum TaxID=53326 RepID=A0A016UDP1_9BILA|nr:hypothetical protein Y032_0044g997 [Ancylostoma ceylanicum]
MLQYAALHQMTVVCDESIAFLKRCRAHRIFPHFIDNLLSNIPYLHNDGVRIGVAQLKLALLRASIAARKRRRGACINKIIEARSRLESTLEPAIWRAFSIQNKSVCSQVRKRERDRLHKKLQNILPSSNSRSSFMDTAAMPPPRCTVIGSKMVDEDMKALLNLGPSFAVATPANQGTLDAVLCGINKFAYQLKWRIHKGPTVLDRTSTILASLPFPKPHITVPKPTPLGPIISALEVDLMREYRSALRSHFATNLTSQELRGLRKLRATRHDFRITVGDKDGGFVVMPRDLDKALTTSALADNSVYERSSYNCFTHKSQILKAAVKSVLRQQWNMKTASRFWTNYPEVPTYYSLVKTHKLDQSVDLSEMDISKLKTRPIISSCGGPADRISWLLEKLLSPLLRYVGSHIVNSNEFIEAIQQCQVPNSACYVSFDAVSLYTNINNDTGIKSLLELLSNHGKEVSLCGFSASDVEILLEAALDCNVFRFNNNFYAQKRGLAMGMRIAPLLAIIYLDHIEKASLTQGILLYKRFIDDVFVIGSSHAELTTTLANLNSKDVNIKFTVEEPSRDGFLPFLNTKIRVRNGTTDIRWYRKGSSKNIILHSRSVHPTYMKVNVVRNLIKTSERIAAGVSETDETIQRILYNNGYSSGEMTTWRPYSSPDGLALVLPYLNEHLAKRVNAIVKRSRLPVRLIFQPPPTLKEILTSSRLYEDGCDEEGCRYCTNQNICHLRGTVYLIKCSECGRRYIGESGRPLRKRLDEHRRAIERPQTYPNNSFSRHRTTVHTRDSAPEFEVLVLHRLNATTPKMLERLYSSN